MKRFLGLLLFYITNRINIRLIFSSLGEHIEKTRAQALRFMGARIAPNSFVRAGAVIIAPKNLTLGHNSKIGDESRLYLFEKLTIGDNVEIGPQFMAYTAEHKLNDPAAPLTKQGAYHKAIMIGSDVYIGARVTLLKGAVIENRVVVGAGALVTGRLESGYIYGGVPAKKIRALRSL